MDDTGQLVLNVNIQNETYVAHIGRREEIMLMVYWRARKNRGLSMRISIDIYSYASCVVLRNKYPRGY